MNRVGEVNKNTQGTLMKIIRFNSNTDIDVQFLDDRQYIKEHTTYTNFRSGHIKNPYDKSLFGVGFIGVGQYKTRNANTHKPTTAYQAWKGIMERCYQNPIKYPAYYGKCEVCEEWQNYQNFAKWYEENEYTCEGRLHIDKDILHPNCNLYSPDNCLLVPQRINMLFLNKPNKRGLPNGISKTPNGYSANYNKQILGTYQTLQEAYSKYADAKETTIKMVAEEYKEIIPNRVYLALCNYKVNIENDKNFK